MPIERIEALTYGVEDMDASARFLGDMGLEPLGGDADGLRFRTVENQIVTVRPRDAFELPPAVEGGSTLRELTWGVTQATELSEIATSLGSHAIIGHDGEIRAIDPNGLGLAFRVSDRIAANPSIRPSNQNRVHGRINERLTPRGRPRPLRIVHVAYNITKARNQESLDFYTRLLRFKPVDMVLDTGTFLQSEGDIEHHNFFLCFRPDAAGINHIALEVYDFDSVMEAGNYMITQGWKESRRAGRHTIGSNAYRFIHAPIGGRIEFVADMDRMDKSWETRVFEKNPGHNIWMLKSSGSEPDGE